MTKAYEAPTLFKIFREVQYRTPMALTIYVTTNPDTVPRLYVRRSLDVMLSYLGKDSCRGASDYQSSHADSETLQITHIYIYRL